jgi:hypothetical protein
VAADLGLSESLIDRLPADAGRITLIDSDQLEAAQAGVRVLDFLSWFVLLVVVALYALGVFLAADRIRALRNVGIGLHRRRRVRADRPGRLDPHRDRRPRRGPTR